LINSIKERTFSGLSNLEQLHLGKNYLTSIKAETFKELSMLTYLGLNFNYLTSLDKSMFDGLSSLRELGLYANKITSIPKETFSHLRALVYLDLGENPITQINPRAFRESFNFKNLGISLNQSFVCSSRVYYNNKINFVDSYCTHEGALKLYEDFFELCKKQRGYHELLKGESELLEIL
jgi:Leucine-rich repeat (LRR) protein